MTTSTIIIVGLFLLIIFIFWCLYLKKKIKQDNFSIIDFANFIILGLTLIAVICYTLLYSSITKDTTRIADDTNRLAKQTIDSALKPTILRGGNFSAWDVAIFSVKNNKIIGEKIQFTNLKNIALDIRGYYIANKKQYALLFCSLGDNNPCYPSWTWLNQNDKISALYHPNQSTATTSENGIYLEYKDTDGNKYYTQQKEDFTQTSGKL